MEGSRGRWGGPRGSSHLLKQGWWGVHREVQGLIGGGVRISSGCVLGPVHYGRGGFQAFPHL